MTPQDFKCELEKCIAQAQASGLSRLDITLEFLETTRRLLVERQLEIAVSSLPAWFPKPPTDASHPLDI